MTGFGIRGCDGKHETNRENVMQKQKFHRPTFRGGTSANPPKDLQADPEHLRTLRPIPRETEAQGIRRSHEAPCWVKTLRMNEMCAWMRELWSIGTRRTVRRF